MSDRPHPRPNTDSAPFWEGCRRGELLFQECADCGAHQFYPRAVCAVCHGTHLEWRRSKGEGTVYSYTVVHRPPSPAFEPPYVLALVDLEEGFRMMLNLRNCAVDEVRIGLPVRIVFEPLGAEGIQLPQAEPRP